MLYQSLSWPQVSTLDFESKVLLLPLGSIEQHGHHLPLATDTAIVEAIAQRVHDTHPDDILLLPTLWCGHSTHHLAFPGTINISQDTYQRLITDICTSLVNSGAKRILLLNGHGGNDVPVRYALRQVKSQTSDIPAKVVFASYWALAADTLKRVRESEAGGMGHACEMETSLMLLLHKELVKMESARRDGPQQIPPYRHYDMQRGVPFYMVEEFNELSETGTVGFPDLATEEKGQQFLYGIVKDVCAFIQDFRLW